MKSDSVTSSNKLGLQYEAEQPVEFHFNFDNVKWNRLPKPVHSGSLICNNISKRANTNTSRMVRTLAQPLNKKTTETPSVESKCEETWWNLQIRAEAVGYLLNEGGHPVQKPARDTNKKERQ